MRLENELAATARAMVAPGKGLLAADESTATIEKRLAAIGVESSEASRRSYREMLFTAKGAAEFISGVILYDETIRQKSADGMPFVELLKSQGIIPGIKVDLGAKDFPGHPGEKVTEGLDGLGKRCAEYYGLGARFAKWRAVLNIGDAIPSEACLIANAHALARYAGICQAAGLVPVVEPEVMMDGGQTVERCFDVTVRTLNHVFHQLRALDVTLEHMILKPNMVVSGLACPRQADVETVAELTIKAFRETVPAAVPGIMFLSGGQSDERATEHLNAMNARGKLPWELSFSYGRALQAPALKAWGGKAANVDAGRRAFLRRARLNSAARFGRYTPALEQDPL
jgi:fructose-bisphosphate aldolase class I